jgi:hypothetical protein
MKQGKIKSRRPPSPTQKEGLYTMGCGLVQQGTYSGTKMYLQDPWINHCIVIIN